MTFPWKRCGAKHCPIISSLCELDKLLGNCEAFGVFIFDFREYLRLNKMNCCNRSWKKYSCYHWRTSVKEKEFCL